MISVQTADFDVGEEYARLVEGDTAAGGVALFVGRVREQNLGEGVRGLTLEHYPGMTEKALADIAAQARQRWALERLRIVHRVGRLGLGEQIVLVGASSAHREQAFAAAEFLMDYLKTRAPFWKKELTETGEHWVAERDSDRQAAARWEQANHQTTDNHR